MLMQNNFFEIFSEEGLPTKKVATMFFSSEIVGNVRNVLMINLDVGDAQIILNYFKQKQVQNSHFPMQCSVTIMLERYTFFLGRIIDQG